MKITSSIVFALSLACFGLSASSAAADDLTGRVAEVFVRSDGSVVADLAGDDAGNLYLCSVESALRGVAPSTCKEMLNLLTSAKLSGTPVVISGVKATTPVSSGSTSYAVTVSYVKLAN